MNKTPAKAKGPGAPRKYAEPMKVCSVRMTEEQEKKMERLGGGAWLRKMIDRAKEPTND